jgi:phosphate transport system protein
MPVPSLHRVQEGAMARTRYDAELAALRINVLAQGGQVHRLVREVAAALVARDMAALAVLPSRRRPPRQAAREVEEWTFTLISLQQPVAGDLRCIIGAQAIVQELARVAAHAADLARIGHRLGMAVPLSLGAGTVSPWDELASPLALAEQMLGGALEAYAALDVRLAAQIWERDGLLDAWNRAFCTSVLDAGRRCPAAAETMLGWLTLAHDLERLGDRATNICERVCYIVTGELAYTHRPTTTG